MEIYVDEKKVTQAINELAEIELRANQFLIELYKNGKYTDTDILSFIANPTGCYASIKKLGYNEAKQFSISAQRELLEKQADTTAARLKQLASEIFIGTSLSYMDIESACKVNKEKVCIETKIAKKLLTAKYTSTPSPLAVELYNKINNVCVVLNNINKFSEDEKLRDQLGYLELKTGYQKFIKGGVNTTLRTKVPYMVDKERLFAAKL